MVLKRVTRQLLVVTNFVNQGQRLGSGYRTLVLVIPEVVSIPFIRIKYKPKSASRALKSFLY